MHIIIITAQDQDIEALKGVKIELRELGIAEVFYADEVDKESILEYIDTMGDNNDLSEDELIKKIFTLWSLYSIQYPSDLPRIGRSNLEVSDDSVSYRLIQANGEDWSSNLQIDSVENANLCLVSTLNRYLDNDYEHEIDRLFLNSNGAFTSEECTNIVQLVLKVLELH